MTVLLGLLQYYMQHYGVLVGRKAKGTEDDAEAKKSKHVERKMAKRQVSCPSVRLSNRYDSIRVGHDNHADVG